LLWLDYWLLIIAFALNYRCSAALLWLDYWLLILIIAD
jgi:hypothetical protein